MMSKIFRGSLFVFILLTAHCSLFTVAFASGLVTVRPAKVELAVSPGDERVVSIAVQNSTPQPMVFTVATEDVNAGGGVDDPFMLAGLSRGAHPLREFLVPEERSFTLLSGETKNLPVAVQVPAGTEPGGRYGSVVIAFRPAENGAASAANVALESRIAVVFFVRVDGQTIVESGDLVRFGLFNDARFVHVPSEASPLLFQVAYQNDGNVHQNPYGRVTLEPLIGEARVIPIDPAAVLPGATRMRELTIKDALTPGYYVAHLELNRGYQDIVDEAEVWFIVLPGTTGMFGIGLGVVVFLLLLSRSLRLSKHFTK